MAITNPQADLYGLSGQRFYQISPQVNMLTTGDKFAYAPAAPIAIFKWGVLANALIDVGAGMILTMDKRVTIGSDTNRVTGSTSSGVDTAGGSLSTSTTDISQGKGIYRVLSQPLIIVPGYEVVVQVSDAADTAGTGYIWFEYASLPFAGDSNLTSLQDANLIYNMTKKTS